MSVARSLALAALALIAGVVAYWQLGEYQKRSQQQAIAEMVGQGSAQARAVLGGTPGKEHIAAIDRLLEQLRGTKASRQIAMLGAAEAYLVSVRAIILRKADVARLTPQAAASRQALDAHVRTLRGRDSLWIRRAAELKKKMDQDHADLDNQLKTFATLVYTLPEAAKPLAPFVDPSLFVEDALLGAAVKQAEADVKRVAEETERAGRLPGR